jgi:hypothetical protein
MQGGGGDGSKEGLVVSDCGKTKAGWTTLDIVLVCLLHSSHFFARFSLLAVVPKSPFFFIVYL